MNQHIQICVKEFCDQGLRPFEMRTSYNNVLVAEKTLSDISVFVVDLGCILC